MEIAGSFSGTATYRSFRNVALEGYPETLTIDDGAFYADIPME